MAGSNSVWQYTNSQLAESGLGMAMEKSYVMRITLIVPPASLAASWEVVL
jgi:hypothetical protein